MPAPRLGPWPAVMALEVLVAAGGVGGAPQVSFRVAKRFQHQKHCFTEGLFLNSSRHDVFESCGLYGRSYLRRYSLRTGETLQTAKVDSRIFSEGLALLGEKLYMLTYRNHRILEFDARTLAPSGRQHDFPYGEGWGLTTDGCDILATTGSAFLYRLRPDASGSLQLVNKVLVTHMGAPVASLNEMEYVTPKVWINQWHTNTLWRVDPATGVCEARLDVGSLHAWRGEQTPNGIAYSAALGSQILLVTGKLWPHTFALHVSPESLCGEPAPAAKVCPRAPPSACWRPHVDPDSVPAGQMTKAGSVAGKAAAGSVATGVDVTSAVVAKAAVARAQAAGRSPAPGTPTGPAAQVVPRVVRPLPGGITAVSLLLAAALAVAAVAVPLRLGARRYSYRRALQQSELAGSA